MTSGRDRSRILPGDAGARRAFGAGGTDAPDPLEEAYRRGLAEGEAAGRELAESHLREELDRARIALAEGLRRLSEAHQQMLREGRDAMIDLALTAASRMLRRAVDAGEPLAARALTEILETLPAAPDMEAHVHPQDLETVREALAAQIEAQQIRLRADTAVARGGCLLHTARGSVDATVETAEAGIRDAAVEPGGAR